MIVNYTAYCPCGYKEKLKYGRENKKEIYEIFSCQKCNNLFSIHFESEKICPECKGKDLISYIPDKKKNMKFYEDMLKKKMISKEKLAELKKYWEKIEDDFCPACKKRTLKWKV